jgi:hypothetical protein
MKRFVVLTAVALSMMACHKNDDKPAPVQPASLPPEAHQAASPSACDILKKVVGGAIPRKLDTQTTTVNIRRNYQRVIRYGQSNKITSDEIETVLDPHADIYLENPDHDNFEYVLVFDEESCRDSMHDMPLTDIPVIGLLADVTGNSKGISIKADMADAVFRFQVAEGLNHIFVRYYHNCRPELQDIENNKDCPNGGSFTTVEYPVQVDYKEQHLPGFKEIRN